MANGAPRDGKNRPVKKRTLPLLRLAGRIAATLMVAVVLSMVGLQYARIVNEDVAMARSLSAAKRDIVELQQRKRSEAREIQRLLDPRGAVPEIHDRLHLVAPNETIIYVKPPRQ